MRCIYNDIHICSHYIYIYIKIYTHISKIGGYKGERTQQIGWDHHWDLTICIASLSESPTFHKGIHGGSSLWLLGPVAEELDFFQGAE